MSRKLRLQTAVAALAIGLTSLAPASTWADAIDDHIQAQAPKVDDYLQTRMKSSRIPGLSVAVMRNGQLLLARAYGMANLEVSAPAAPNSVYQIGSITKQFTAAAIMLLVEEGKVSLDEKITAYLPNLPERWGPVTVRHLLTHTSGIPSYTGLNSFWNTHLLPITQRELIDLVAKLPLQFQPGARWAYSNTGYFLLGMIIEKAGGKNYRRFLAERIFQPLQMNSTMVNDFGLIIPHRASGYTQSGALRNAELHSPTRSFAAGAMVSSVEDLARWEAALWTEALLKRSSLEQMWTPVTLNDGKQYPYGFGWVVDNYQKKNMIIHHGGGIPGFTTAIKRYVDDRLTLILLTNFDGADPYPLADGVRRIVTTGLPAPSP